jgi:hypothetical protein
MDQALLGSIALVNAYERDTDSPSYVDWPTKPDARQRYGSCDRKRDCFNLVPGFRKLPGAEVARSVQTSKPRNRTLRA